MEKSLVEVIEMRRSVRSFLETPIDDKTVRQLIDAAIKAPTGSNLQPWVFGIVRDKSLIEKIKMFSPGLGGMPPCLIVVCSDKKLAFEKGGELGRDVLTIMDTSMAAENLMLRACDLGLGTCAVKSFQPKAVSTLLRLPSHFNPELIITVGYPASEPGRMPRRGVDEVVFYNRWEEELK